MELVVNKLTFVELPKFLRLGYWFEKTLCELVLELPDLSQKPGIIELNFVDSAIIRKLNRRYRGMDNVTDVLSFSFLGQGSFPGDDLVGQIFIDSNMARKQAAEHKVSMAAEIQYLFVHGLLHVFGFDHETESDFKRMSGFHARIMPDPMLEAVANQIRRDVFGG